MLSNVSDSVNNNFTEWGLGYDVLSLQNMLVSLSNDGFFQLLFDSDKNILLKITEIEGF